MSEGGPRKPDIGAIFRDGTPIDRALRRAANDAHVLHKKLGSPIVVWEDGKVVWIPPERIRVDGG